MAKTTSEIRQSIVHWCFNICGEKWDTSRICQVAKQIGYGSIELADRSEWSTILEHGLEIAIAPNVMPGAMFIKGFNNPAYHA